jgi:hypothetical protein
MLLNNELINYLNVIKTKKINILFLQPEFAVLMLSPKPAVNKIGNVCIT